VREETFKLNREPI